MVRSEKKLLSLSRPLIAVTDNRSGAIGSLHIMGGKKVCRLVWLLLLWGGLCGIQREEDIAVAMPNLLAYFCMALHLYMYSWKQIYGEFAIKHPGF
jgi:hypothetical protein